MPFTISDSTVSTQRLAVDNSSNVEFGSATPSSSLSVQGRQILSGSDLAQLVASPPAMTRVTGAVVVGGGATTIVSCPTAFGIGTINGGGGVVGFNSALNQFEIYSYETSSTTLEYGVF